jgi:hypothetical protein
MKYNNYFLIFICMISFFVFSSCEHAELQKSSIDDQKISTRTEIECEDCPVADCCCAVELLEGSNVQMEFCGTSSPNVSTVTCGPDYWGNCTIQGYILNLLLQNVSEFEIFCMPVSSAFWIKSQDTGSVRITCKYGQTGYTSQDVTFPGKTNLFVDGECDISGHCP